MRGLLAALAALLIVPAAAHGATIPVAPGGSLTAAYQAAAAGDVIELSSGQYGAWKTPAGSKPVTVRAGTGQRPVLRQLANNADNITFDGLDVDGGGTLPDMNMAVFESGGRENVTFKNGRIGDVIDQKGAMLGGSASPASTHLVIDNVDFHDVIQRGAGVHNECVMSHAPGVTIRNSTFRNCATFDISLGRGDWWGQPVYGGVTLENNVFGHSVNGSGWHWYGLAWWLELFRDARVLGNTFENSVMFDPTRYPAPYSGVWANNVGGGWDCLPGVTYTGNIGKKCSPTDKAISPSSSCAPPACGAAVTAPFGWASPAAFDFHLAFGSPAIDVGDAAYASATDRDGKARVGKPDAGAYEFGVAPDPTPTPGPSPTATPTPEPTPSATPDPTVEPTPTATPAPTPNPAPACAPTCDEQIADLKATVEARNAVIADLKAKIANALSALED